MGVAEVCKNHWDVCPFLMIQIKVDTNWDIKKENYSLSIHNMSMSSTSYSSFMQHNLTPFKTKFAFLIHDTSDKSYLILLTFFHKPLWYSPLTIRHNVTNCRYKCRDNHLPCGNQFDQCYVDNSYYFTSRTSSSSQTP